MGPTMGLGTGLAVAAPSAHPGGDTPHVAVPIGIVVLATVAVVVVAAVAVPPRRATGTDGEADVGVEESTTSWAGTLTRPQWVVRAIGLATLLLAVLAGRVGADDELENLAPALVVGAGLPLLVVGSLVLGRLWRWVDPWDSLARLVAPGDRSGPPGHVWPAVVAVLPLLWFLGVYPRPLDPRAVGLALAAYTVVTLAGCLATGRVRWLASAEPLGALLSWFGLVPRRRLTAWRPPAGAAVLLGVVIGGLLFGALRRTELWSPVAVLPLATLYATAGLLVACALGGATAVLAGRAGGSPEQRAVVARALVPVAAGVVVAVSVARNRLSTSVQLLPGLVGDPLGRGWDLLGTPTDGLDAAPLGAVGLVVLQLTVVTLAHLLGAATAPRALVGDERLPVIVLLAGSVAAGAATLSLH
ncbi:MAG TPA: hypothetical protein VFY58_08445 [Nocardioides sp.]|nr:hypothetical protein [Nocardioides sp.]